EAGDGHDTVRLTLPGWGNQLKVTLDGMLARSDIPHVWEAGDLVVPSSVREQVADLLDAVEGRSLEPGADDGESIALEIEGLDPDLREDLDARLLASSVDHSWSETGELVISPADEDRIMDMIDDVFAGDVPEEDGIDTVARLSELYVALDRLTGRPGDHKAEADYAEAVETVRDLPVPYGFDGAAWSDLMRRAEALVNTDDSDSDDGTDPHG